MLFTHIHLLRRNASTVEWHGVQNMRERERAVLSQAIPVCQCLGMGPHENGGLLGSNDESPWNVDAAKEMGLPPGFRGRKTLRNRWDEEWGRIGKEGHLWWCVYSSPAAARFDRLIGWVRVGPTGMRSWVMTHGHGSVRIFIRRTCSLADNLQVPVGDTSRAGLNYPINPRFDERGRWMRRRDWPLELR